MNRILMGIDLGGSNTSIFVKGEGIVFKEPSLISVKIEKSANQIKRKIIAFGNDAKKLKQEAFFAKDESILTFSPISQGIIKSDDYTAHYLKYAFSKILKKLSFSKIDCLASVPCGTSDEEAQIYKLAIQKAGIKNVEIVRAPICNAFSAENNGYLPNNLMVVDIGGSNIDVAIVSGYNIIKGATLGFGGRAIDNSIRCAILEGLNLSISIIEAEKIKNTTGSLLENDVLSLEIQGLDTSSDELKTTIIHSNQIYPLLHPYFIEISKVMRATLIGVSEEIQQQILADGIIFCGGVSSLTGVCEYFQKEIGIKTYLHPNNQNSTIIGISKLLK